MAYQPQPTSPVVPDGKSVDRYDLVRCSPFAMIVSHWQDQRVEMINDKFVALFGYTMEDMPDVDHWWPMAYPDPAYREAMQQVWRKRIDQAIAKRTGVDTLEARVRCKDGTFRDIEFHLSVLGDSFLVSFVDLTARKRAEAALRTSEERFHLAAAAGKMYAYQWDAASDVFVRSEECRNVLGRDALLEIPRTELLSSFLPEDRERVSSAMASLLPENPAGSVIYRSRCADNSVVWLEQSFRASFDYQGNLCGLVGMVADISLRKEAEQSLANLGGRLIEAQEQERRRIARELHDDINQRLALIAIEIQQIASDKEHVNAQVRAHAERIRQVASQLTSDISSLTQQLYSSRLELLGIVPAMREFCEELRQRQNIKVELLHDTVPGELPRDISLCLFRVFQEGLQNATKHSGQKSFEAELRSNEQEIRLDVRDHGVGFDPQAALRGRGLGLLSMRERVALVNGSILVQSRPNVGTEIRVRIPLPQ